MLEQIYQIAQNTGDAIMQIYDGASRWGTPSSRAIL